MLFYALSLAIAAVDQLIKYFVHTSMYLGQSIPLIGILRLTYVRNTGAAFSLFIGFSPYLAAVGVVIALAVIYYHYRVSPHDYYLQTALAFILGGSLGNLIDRIARSYVIDYLDITIWPVFNFADLMINLGVLQVLFRYLRKEKKHASRTL